MVAQTLGQIGGAEPSFDAPAQTITAFFMARNSQLFPPLQTGFREGNL
jgi:hypothetical protein